jgi:rhamnosyltransferase
MPAATNRPSVCVLLAAYNGGPWIAEQVRSIYRQRGADVALCISDDTSSDGTIDAIRATASALGRNPLLKSGKSGSASANFFGLIRDASTLGFDYIALSDQDDIWRENHLSRAITCIQNTGSPCYSSDVIAFWPDGRKCLIKKKGRQTTWDHLFESPGPGCTFVMHAAVFKHLQRDMAGMSQELLATIKFHHDWFLYFWARTNGYSWFIDSYPSIFYRQHLNNALGANQGMTAAQRRINLLYSGWLEKQILVMATLARADNLAPIRILRRGNRFGSLTLACVAPRLRRTILGKMVLSFYFAFRFLAGKSSAL